MHKQLRYTDWSAKERLALIRKQNVERHVAYGAKQKLRSNILRHTKNQNEQMEHDRLKAATAHGKSAILTIFECFSWSRAPLRIER